MRVKVCGVTREEDARLACELGAWAVGLIFASKSPRRLSLARAKRIRTNITGALAVGVFQDASRTEVLRAVKECRLDAVQLHGGRSFRVPVPVIRAFSFSPKKVPGFAGTDLFAVLLEPARTDAERAAGRAPGPAARRAVWKTAAALKKKGRMMILAGGLTPANVAQAVKVGKPDAVDVSGGIESGLGVKDPKKLRAFFKALA